MSIGVTDQFAILVGSRSDGQVDVLATIAEAGAAGHHCRGGSCWHPAAGILLLLLATAAISYHRRAEVLASPSAAAVLASGDAMPPRTG
jgi:hypothetical protein